MMVLIILVTILVIWEIGLKATVRGAVNGCKRAKDYIDRKRKDQ